MVLDFLLAPFSRNMAIDLGTTNTLVYVRSQKIVIREPSIVALEAGSEEEGEILAVGNEARSMVGRTPEDIKAVWPLEEGVIADIEVTRNMLSYFITEAHSRSWLVRPQLIVCVPSGITGVEKKSVVDAAFYAGAREAYLIEEPIAAAIGAGMPIHEATGNMVVDIGGGTTEVAVISLGGIISQKSLRIGGDEMDKNIMNYLKDKYNLMIGAQTAEEIKISIGSACFTSSSDVNSDDFMEVRGRNLVNGLPKTVNVTAGEIQEALQEPLEDIIEAVKGILEETPPASSVDIMNRGMVLAGGGGLLSGLAHLLAEEVGVPVYLADNPLDCVAKGTGKVLEEIKTSQDILITSNQL